MSVRLSTSQLQQAFNEGDHDCATFEEYVKVNRELEELYEQKSTPALGRTIQGLEQRIGA